MTASLDLNGHIAVTMGNANIRTLVVGITAFRLNIDFKWQHSPPQVRQQRVTASVFRARTLSTVEPIYVPVLAPFGRVSVEGVAFYPGLSPKVRKSRTVT